MALVEENEAYISTLRDFLKRHAGSKS